MSWSEIKKAINDNFNYPLNKQKYLIKTFPFIASGTFNVPQTGVYIVTCVGPGGNGGNCTGNRYTTNAFFGGSGGSGAIARSKLSLTQNTNIAITVTDAVSSFGSYLSATAGGNGSNGPYTDPPTGGAGGVASGGNILNLNGRAGNIVMSSRATAALGASTPLTTLNATNYASKYLESTETAEIISSSTVLTNYGGSGFNPLPMVSFAGVSSYSSGSSGSASANLATDGVSGDGGSCSSVTSCYSYGGGGGYAFGGGGGGGKVDGEGNYSASGGTGAKGLVYIEFLEPIIG